MKNKTMKIIGIGAAMLMSLVAFIPACSAAITLIPNATPGVEDDDRQQSFDIDKWGEEEKLYPVPHNPEDLRSFKRQLDGLHELLQIFLDD